MCETFSEESSTTTTLCCQASSCDDDPRYIAKLECLHGSVRRLLMNMSNHTHDVYFTQAASKWISERCFEANLHNQTATRSRGKLLIAPVTSSRHSGIAACRTVAMTTITDHENVPREHAAAVVHGFVLSCMHLFLHLVFHFVFVMVLHFVDI